MPLVFAVSMIVMARAKVSAPVSAPANNQFFCTVSSEFAQESIGRLADLRAEPARKGGLRVPPNAKVPSMSATGPLIHVVVPSAGSYSLRFKLQLSKASISSSRIDICGSFAREQRSHLVGHVADVRSLNR
ncbi:hypothetical protein NKI19_30720 [Mesorhizobium sp. M0751]|uniref:hypothetical protein n=1 Tax=unclassified Mesorhizobium TaxID=325217 RepID=UPI00333DE84C